MSVTSKRRASGARFSDGVRRITEHSFLRHVSQDSLVLTEQSRGSALDVSSISEEELQRELSLLGYPRVPQQVILQFKEDLMCLMSQRCKVKTSLEEPVKEPNSSGSVADSACPTLSFSQVSAPQNEEPCGEEAVHVGGRRSQKATLTRKVLRRTINGQTRVSDESSLFSETEDGDSHSSVESSSHISAECMKSFIRPPPYSLLDQYRLRSDPVSRYQEYKQSWDAIQGALDRSRKELRWEIREQMMSAPPHPLPRPLPAPNSYIVPTDKKRYGLRWAVRRDMVNGVIPRSSFS